MTPSISADRRRQLLGMLTDIRERAMNSGAEAQDVIDYAKAHIVALGALWSQQDRTQAPEKPDDDGKFRIGAARE